MLGPLLGGLVAGALGMRAVLVLTGAVLLVGAALSRVDAPRAVRRTAPRGRAA